MIVICILLYIIGYILCYCIIKKEDDEYRDWDTVVLTIMVSFLYPIILPILGIVWLIGKLPKDPPKWL